MWWFQALDININGPTLAPTHKKNYIYFTTLFHDEPYFKRCYFFCFVLFRFIRIFHSIFYYYTICHSLWFCFGCVHRRMLKIIQQKHTKINCKKSLIFNCFSLFLYLTKQQCCVIKSDYEWSNLNHSERLIGGCLSNCL